MTLSAALLLALAVTVCSGSGDRPTTVDEPGERLVIEVAPLSLPNAADVRWRLTVDNAAGEQVWQKTVTSGAYRGG